jgi:hypothetical protein
MRVPWLPYPESESLHAHFEAGHLIRHEEHPSGACVALRSGSAGGTAWCVILTILNRLVLKRYFSERRQAEEVFETLEEAAEDLLQQIGEACSAEQERLIQEFALRFS